MKHSVLIKINYVLQQVAKKERQDEKVGVVLSGCGVYDGSEIHEAVITLLARKAGGGSDLFRARQKQADVINHLTGEAMAETRNVLIEAARIARGDVHPLIQADAAELDALIVPGGFGAAKISVPLLQKGRRVRSIPI